MWNFPKSLKRVCVFMCRGVRGVGRVSNAREGAFVTVGTDGWWTGHSTVDMVTGDCYLSVFPRETPFDSVLYYAHSTYGIFLDKTCRNPENYSKSLWELKNIFQKEQVTHQMLDGLVVLVIQEVLWLKCVLWVDMFFKRVQVFQMRFQLSSFNWFIQVFCFLWKCH